MIFPPFSILIISASSSPKDISSICSIAGILIYFKISPFFKSHFFKIFWLFKLNNSVLSLFNNKWSIFSEISFSFCYKIPVLTFHILMVWSFSSTVAIMPSYKISAPTLNGSFYLSEIFNMLSATKYLMRINKI